MLDVHLPLTRNWNFADGNHDGGVSTGVGFTIAWQRGSLDRAGRNGAFLIEVLHSCYLQLEYYQRSKFACDENAVALHHLDEALKALQFRRDRRQENGTLGTIQVD